MYCFAKKDMIKVRHRNPKREMKPLNKLEKEMFEAMIGRPYDDCKKEWYGSKDNFNIAVQNARDCAKVAVDLAFKAYLSTMNFTGFLKSEGIETEK